MSERIELWATVRSGLVQAYYRDRDLAERLRRPEEQIVHLVELRDRESIAANGETGPVFKVDDLVRHRQYPDNFVGKIVSITQHVRANVLWANDLDPCSVFVSNLILVGPTDDRPRTVPESELAAMKERAEKAEAEVKQLCRDFYAKRMDERAKFERETAAKLLAALWGSDWNGDADDATARIIERARKLTDHYFGAKEAKGDE